MIPVKKELKKNGASRSSSAAGSADVVQQLVQDVTNWSHSVPGNIFLTIVVFWVGGYSMESKIERLSLWYVHVLSSLDIR